VSLTGEIRRPPGRRNPGAFDFAFYLRNRGIGALLDVSEARVLRRGRGIAGAADWIERAIRRRVPGDSADLLSALLLGRSASLPEKTQRSFRRAGTVHVLAVSGLHVGFIMLVAHALLRSLRAPPRIARVLCVPAIAVFVLLIGPRPSAMRAVLMAAALTLSSTLERKTRPLNTLGVAGLALLLVQPGSLFDVGFQLSFSAIGGILLLHGWLSGILRRPLTALGGLGRRLADLAALSLSAQAGVAPALIGQFGEISLVAPLANLAAVPLAGAAVASGICVVASHAIGGIPARAFAATAWVTARSLLCLTQSLGRMQWSAARVDARFWPVALCLTAALAVFATARGGRGRRVGYAVLALGLVTCVAIARTGPARSVARAVFFDVGQGDSVLLELPWRNYVLIDTGPGPTDRSGGSGRVDGTFRLWDAGAGVVVPYLRRAGVGSLEALIVTHAHADHLGGAASVVQDAVPKRLVLPSGGANHGPFVALVRHARERGAQVLEVETGDTLAAGSFRLSVLAPPAVLRAGVASENNSSVVVRLEMGGFSLLLTGDIEDPVEKILLRTGVLGPTDVLKVPHHGSATSSGERFVQRIGPSLAVIEVGEGNRFGHPDRCTLRTLESAGATVMRTDRDGAVVVTFGEDLLVAEAVASGSRWTLRRTGRVRASSAEKRRRDVRVHRPHHGHRAHVSVDHCAGGLHDVFARHR
jgi:competence protein ComEC